jgi:predicted XRE-type DNA-binding protein
MPPPPPSFGEAVVGWEGKRIAPLPRVIAEIALLRFSDSVAVCRCRSQEGDWVMARKVKVEMGSGNIFADLGMPDAEAHFLKAQIVSEICRLTNERKLTRAQAGKRMGISQPEVSRMFKGNFREYSIDRLMGFLTSFDRDVETW